MGTAQKRLSFPVQHAWQRRLQKAPRTLTTRLRRDFTEACKREGFLYETASGQLRLMSLALSPLMFSLEQERYYREACRVLLVALDRIAEAYEEAPALRRLLPFEVEERAFLRRIGGLSWPTRAPIFGRLDAAAAPGEANWRSRLQFFEANTSGAGGIHYTAAGMKIALDTAREHFKLGSLRRLRCPSDPRALLFDVLGDLARELGRPSATTAFLQDTSARGGPHEFPFLVEYFLSRGRAAVLVHPQELEWRRGELWLRELKIDLVYREPELWELEWWRRRDVDVTPLVQAFRRGQVVSPAAGDLDHKSAWHILTDPQFARLFPVSHRRILRRHIPWTRLLGEYRTTNSRGQRIDLVAYVEGHRARLVLKPNRDFAGSGVLVGAHTTQRRWEGQLEHALDEPGSYVVQRYAEVPIQPLAFFERSGKLQWHPYTTVFGFYATRRGLAVCCRAGRGHVVNVARGGGLVPVLLEE